MQKYCDVWVRIDSGSVRNLDISAAPAVGSKVIVEGNKLRMAAAEGVMSCITLFYLPAARHSAQIFGV